MNNHLINKDNLTLSFDLNAYFQDCNFSQFNSESQQNLTINNSKNLNSCRTNDDEFYDSTQVLQQVDQVLSNYNDVSDSEHHQLDLKAPIKKIFKKIKPNDIKDNANSNWNETVTSEISTLFKTTQYKQEISNVFNNLEATVCEVTSEQDFNNSLKNNNSTLNTTVTIRTSTDMLNSGPFYKLPLKIKELYQQYRGIDKLYDWQDECLNLDAIKKRKNLVYALPTSGGKTLVSEILIFQELLCRKKNVIFVLPYVSIVQEKVWALSPFALALDFLVEEYAAGKGGYPPRKRRYKHSIYVATIEKALALVNSLTEMNRLDEIGLIVVDELHLIGEEGRGATLETLLTKIIYSNENIQIIGMSATIGNLKEICTFLKADVYTKDFRPIELKEYIKCRNNLYQINRNAHTDEDRLQLIRSIDKNQNDTENIDPDNLAILVNEVVPTGSCLVFCASKKNCENVAKLLCRILSRTLLEHKKNEKEELLHSLRNESDGIICPILRATIPFGIAYHHSGLTGDERQMIETGFRMGILCCICCTSTLAAGVNLPARRVLLRSPYVGREFISLTKYKQMAGRAGRAGLGETYGESILVCDQKDLQRVINLLCSPIENVLSRLHINNSKGLRNMILSCIALETATSRRTLRQVTECSLLAIQEEQFQITAKKATDHVITELFKMGAIQLLSNNEQIVQRENISLTFQQSISTGNDSSLFNIPSNQVNTERKQIIIENDSKLSISKLGKAAIKGGLDLDTAHILYDDLIQAQSGLVLHTCLHLLYLVTPYDLIKHIQPSLPNYYSIYSELNANELQTARVLGLNEACCVGMLTGRRVRGVDERILNRFYLTLALYELWNEKSVFHVAERFQLSRGIVQQLMVSAATFASNVVRFCEQLREFWHFAYLLRGMALRLEHCSTRELEPLMQLPAVKVARAKQLYNAGYKTLQHIARANPNHICNSVKHISYRIANQLIAAAKLLLLERVENLREEAEDVLDELNLSLHVTN